MTVTEIAAFYSNLSHGEKGIFTAFVSCRIGGSPHTWQNRFLKWSRQEKMRPVSPLVRRELNSIIESSSWRS